MGVDDKCVPFWRKRIRVLAPPSPQAAGAALLGLWGFAFVHPVLGMLGEAPAFFSAQDVSGWPVVVWSVLIGLGPPLILLGVYMVIRARWPRVSLAFLAGSVGILVSLALAPRIDDVLYLPLTPLLGVAALVLVGAAGAFTASSVIRRLASATWFSPLVFTGLFLFASPASELVMPGAHVAEVTAAKPVGLVMIVMDEFPLAVLLDEALSIDRRRFPGFAALADQSTLYRNATTASVWTERAVPALLSGMNPPGAGFDPRKASEVPRNLFSMLYRTHELNTIEPVAKLCNLPGCNRIEPGPITDMYRATAIVGLRAWAPDEWADVHLRFLAAGWSFLPGEDKGRLGRLESFISRIEAGQGGSDLWFSHVMAPHRPYHMLPGGYLYPGGWYQPPGVHPGEDSYRWHSDQRIVDLMRQRLVLQVQAVDELIGRLARAIGDGSISDETMVVVTADHGISFDPEANLRGADLRDSQVADIAAVPLFIRYPGQSTGELTDRPTSLIDVVPTIADAMDVDLPESWEFDGESLLRPARTTGRIIYDSHRPIDLPAKIDLIEAVERYRGVGANHPDPGEVYALGPLGERVGRTWNELGAIDSGPAGVLEDASRFGTVARDEPVPALVQATVELDHEARWGLVAINGIVAGTGPVYEHEGVSRLAVMVKPSEFVDGDNRVQIALSDDAGRTLRSVVLRD